MSNLQRTTPDQPGTLEQILVQGNLASLSSDQRVEYVDRLCRHLELDPITRPFEFIVFQGKLVCYANKGCAEQLRLKRRISIQIVDRETIDGVHMVRARAFDASGRQDEATGALNVKGMVGEPLANAMMKAETKAKRRVTLSMCGLGMMDDSEVESMLPVEPIPTEPAPSRTAALAGRLVADAAATPMPTPTPSSPPDEPPADPKTPANQNRLADALAKGAASMTSDDQQIDDDFAALLAQKGVTLDDIKAKATTAVRPHLDQPPHTWPDSFRTRLIERLSKKPDVEPAV